MRWAVTLLFLCKAWTSKLDTYAKSTHFEIIYHNKQCKSSPKYPQFYPLHEGTYPHSGNLNAIINM
jgi:hypothetical protein